MLRRSLLFGVMGVLAAAAMVAIVLRGGGSPAPRRPRATAAPARRSVAATRALVRARRAAFWRRHIDATAPAPASASSSHCQKAPPPVPEHPISHRQWLSGVTITEYYPAPETWFSGRRVRAPGLPGRHAADWLYSARGLAMEGDGVDLHGHRTHIAALGSTGWVNAGGHPTVPVCLGEWSDGSPVWLIGGWRNRHGGVTFPLAAGGWSNGRGGRRLPYGGVTFAPEPSRPLRYYHSVAVDPRLIPLGSRVYVPAYRHIGGGWFTAQDTGGAIKGRHIDVYRPPPLSPADLGRYMTRRRILVIPPQQ
ncbi:MAG TPA: 3D domain-containing protein [Solirubrobacteraceae bacterium]|nr:3D domain-containing protein [Solirubrobacteraceae bacterium]